MSSASRTGSFEASAAATSTRRAVRDRHAATRINGHHTRRTASAICSPARALPRAARRNATLVGTSGSFLVSAAADPNPIAAPAMGWPEIPSSQLATLQLLMRTGAIAPGWRLANGAADDPYVIRWRAHAAQVGLAAWCTEDAGSYLQRQFASTSRHTRSTSSPARNASSKPPRSRNASVRHTMAAEGT